MGTHGAPSSPRPVLMRSSRASFGFALLARETRTRARVGVFTTPHGDVPTPAFMPVGTRGTVKGVLPRATLESLSRRFASRGPAAQERSQPGTGRAGSRALDAFSCLVRWLWP